MTIRSIGDRVRPGVYAVQTRFSRSVWLRDAAGHALFVVNPAIGAGPLNLVVDDPPGFVAGETLVVPLRVAAPRFDSALPQLDGAARAALRRVLESALPRHAPPDSLVSLFVPASKPSRFQQARDERFRQAFATIAAGRLAAGVRLIRGCGGGLTPSGDDFLCGWMLACRLRRASTDVIRKNAIGNNPVSNAFLELAAQGRVNVAVKRLLQSPSSARMEAVCAFGHSSGAELLSGLRFGLS